MEENIVHRSPTRIRPFLDIIAEEWEEIPDLRFGQVFTNFFSWVYDNKKYEAFYLEDEVLAQYFREYCEEVKKYYVYP